MNWKKILFFYVDRNNFDVIILSAIFGYHYRFTQVGEGNHLLMSDAFPYGYSPFGGETLSKGKTDVDGSADDDVWSQFDF